jgi:serine/threonine protein kinase
MPDKRAFEADRQLAMQRIARARLFDETGDALPVGTRLEEYELVSVVGQGGFGIVYLARDLTLDRLVAIKEYMPSTLATRSLSMAVSVRSTRNAETFAAGLRSFVNEARLLARFDHPSLLKVHRFWEANGTAYMAMPYYQGTTLGKRLPELGGKPSEAWLRALILPLLDALELMHTQRCLHRDISPDNILLLADGRPLLLDFGAARQVIGDMTQALTVILKTGYAPVEQYGEMPELKQGPWTDLYALGSVVEFAITGRTPPPALSRYLSDRREPLAVVADGRYTDAFLEAIDRSLAVLPRNRPQDAAEMRELLGRGSVAAQRSTAIQVDARVGDDQLPTLPPVSRRSRPDTAAGAATEQVPPASPPAAPVLPPPSTPAASAPPLTPVLPRSAAPPRAWTMPPARATSPRWGVVVVAGIAAVAAAALGYAWLAGTPASPQAATQPSPAGDGSVPTAPPLPTAVALPAPGPQPDAADAGSTAPLPIAPLPVSANPETRSPVREAPPAAARPAPRAPSRSPLAARCADIIQRGSLGEELGDGDKLFLKQECRR